jgi:hypothetical protein
MKAGVNMTDVEFIRSMEAIPFEKYANVSSREKLIAYTISYLREHKIQTNFNNLCVAAFKLFPEKFYFSEEYPEYPHIEMLNRTILHLRPKENNYATGSARSDYILTEIGEEIVRQVQAEITSGIKIEVTKKPMDSHKQTQANEYFKIINSKGYNDFLASSEVDIDHVWSLFEVTPYTQIEKSRRRLENVLSFCSSSGDIKCKEYLEKLIKILK